MSAGFMFLAFKKRITDRISRATGFSIFLEHFKHTGRCANAVRLFANCVLAFQKDQQTLYACAS
jgi:hypothetical protein